MSVPVTEIQDGFNVHVMRSADVEVRIIPALGAKIASLINLNTGREWMWSPPERKLFSNRTGDSFPQGTTLGADECFPTIAACSWHGLNLPDHGEVWTEAWTVESVGASLRTRLKCPISPFVIERTATLSTQRLTLDYGLINTGNDPEEYLWALHPLLCIQPGDRIELPASSVRVDAAMRCPLGGRGRRWNWPVPVTGISLDQMDFGRHGPAAVKVYTDDLREGNAAVINDRTGDRLEFRFELEEINTVGLWINRGGWNGYHHVALEPTNGAPDPLDTAVREWGRFGRLNPGETRKWKLQIIVS